MIEDLKHALRLYLRTPGASLVAIAVLAVGMAFVTAFVSLYVDLILRPHPGIEDSSRLVTVTMTDGRDVSGLPAADVNRISRESAALDALAGTFVVAFEHDAMPQPAELVTRDFFAGIKPRLAHGRGFLPEEHELDGARVTVISHRFWQDALGGREEVIGTTIDLTARNFVYMTNFNVQEPEPKTFRIVGIMAPEFAGVRAQPGRQLAFWLPLESTLPMLVSSPDAQRSEAIQSALASLSTQTIGKRKPGATTGAIVRELDARFLEDTLPQVSSRPGFRFDALAGLVLNPKVHRSTQRQLQLFLGASVLLAIVAAANVSLFLLARAPGRRRELGIRMTVGAPLRRLTRQLATEASLLVTIGATLGLVLSIWLAEYLRNLTFLRQAQWRNVTLLDWRVLVLVGVCLGLLTLLVSLAPVVSLKRLGIAASSRQISARATTAQRVAGTAQIAIAGVLGGAALAFVWYLGVMLVAYPGFETRNVHALPYSVPVYRAFTPGNLALARASARDAIAALPGVAAVSLTGAAPGAEYGAGTRGIPDPQRPDERLSVRAVPIDASYVDVLGLRLLYGSSPSESERDAVLVNRQLAHRLFGRDDVVGEFIALSSQTAGRRIAGVLEDLSFEHPLAEVPPTVFLMYTSENNPLLSGIVLIESAQPPAALQAAITGLVESGALEITIGDVTPLAAMRNRMLAPDRARSYLTVTTATLVVLLAAFGFYGTQRYLVAAGRREYAIRASIGAGPHALGRLVMTRGLWLGLPGLVLGLPFAFIVVAWLRDDYVSRDVSPALVTTAVALGLAVLLIVASIGPARQARTTQPAPLLRED